MLEPKHNREYGTPFCGASLTHEQHSGVVYILEDRDKLTSEAETLRAEVNWKDELIERLWGIGNTDDEATTYRFHHMMMAIAEHKGLSP